MSLSEVEQNEAAAAVAEMVELSTFLQLCMGDPELALAKINLAERWNPKISSTCMTSMYKFYCLRAKVEQTHQAEGDGFSSFTFDYCCECLQFYSEARKAAINEGQDIVDALDQDVDSAATLLEKHVPGKVQEILGQTKLLYLLLAGRMNFLEQFANDLPPSDLKEICDLKISLPFTIRRGVIADVSFDSPRKTARILLCEEPDLYGADGKMNPLKGILCVAKDSTTNNLWSIESLQELHGN